MKIRAASAISSFFWIAACASGQEPNTAPNPASIEYGNGPYLDIPEQQARRWSLEAQVLGFSESPAGNRVAEGVLTLSNPDRSIVYSYNFRSGGYGEYGDNSALPLLDEDFTGPGDGRNGYYLIDWRGYNPNATNLKSAMMVNGVGSFLRIAPPEGVTLRGRLLDEKGWGSFGIHTDGSNLSRNGTPDDGTEGCIGIDAATTADFFEKIGQLNSLAKPLIMVVKEPTPGPSPIKPLGKTRTLTQN